MTVLVDATAYSMSSKIWKFPFDVEDDLSIAMPKNSEIVDVQVQGEQPCIWAICNSDESYEKRRFVIVGTGHPLGIIGKYIGTFQLLGGSFVGHLFEVPA